MGNMIVLFWMFFLISEDQIKHLMRNQKVLNLQMFFITKLKALLIKSSSNPHFFDSTHCMKIWLLFDIAVPKIFEKFQEKALMTKLLLFFF